MTPTSALDSALQRAGKAGVGVASVNITYGTQQGRRRKGSYNKKKLGTAALIKMQLVPGIKAHELDDCGCGFKSGCGFSTHTHTRVGNHKTPP